ncbi:MAG: sulfite exporter TauE/SafE family protein [Eubacteriales bacterium]|nr:sulfite exporter TauE/SafE family protein [Eubacteriales bacterium]
MHLTPLTFFIVCPLVFLAGLVDAVAGGGGLISIPAYLFAGLPVHTVIGTNKLSSAMGTTLATYRYGKSGFIHWRIAAPCAVFAVFGSSLGANLSLSVDATSIKYIMLILLPFLAVYVLRNKSLEHPKAPFSYRRTLVLCLLIALTAGVYDGFYGPGTGTFLMLLLTGLAHVSLNESAGTTKVINLTTNITSLVVFLHGGVVLLPLGLAAGAFNIAGSYLGTRLFTSKGAAFVKPIICIVLLLFAARLCSELFF